MSDRSVRRRIALVGAAIACFALASATLVLALDVVRWNDAITSGDIRFRAHPEATDLWEPSTLVPFGVARALAGLADDVEFRRAVRALRLSRLEESTVSDPELALRRNEALARFEAIVAGAEDPARRSRAAGLLGALGLARLVSETQERVAVLEATVANLQLAIALDPSNVEAKYNLELALQRGRGIQLTEGAGGANPAPGGSGAKGAGAGDPGSGY